MVSMMPLASWMDSQCSISMDKDLGSLEEIMSPFGEVIFLSVKALMRRIASYLTNSNADW